MPGAEQNQLEPHEALKPHLMHEFFHVLETTRLGLTSKEFTVPLITIGPCKLGKQAFTHYLNCTCVYFNTYYELLHNISGTGGNNES